MDTYPTAWLGPKKCGQVTSMTANADGTMQITTKQGPTFNRCREIAVPRGTMNLQFKVLDRGKQGAGTLVLAAGKQYRPQPSMVV
jgi:hypothetical protein